LWPRSVATESQVHVLCTWVVLELTAAKCSPPREKIHIIANIVQVNIPDPSA
jgi:hypothetical protein